MWGPQRGLGTSDRILSNLKKAFVLRGSFRSVPKLLNFKKFWGISSDEEMNVSSPLEGWNLVGDLLKVWESPVCPEGYCPT